MDSNEVAKIITGMAEGFEKFKAKYDHKIHDLEITIARGEFSGGGSSRDFENKTAAKDHKAGFLAYTRNGSDPEGLRRLEIAASMSTDSNPDGGYLVPVEIDKNIERLALASVAMRRLATIKTSKGEFTKPLSIGGATGGWVAERATRAETDTPELTLFSPPMCEIYAMPSTTQKLLDMSDFDVEGWILEEINDVFVNTEGTGFITGNGVGQVHGILDTLKMIANASWTYGKTGFITSGHASLINNADKIIDLQHALKPVYRANGTWLMNDLTFAVIRKLKDGNGNYIVMPGLVGGAPDFLLGRPVEIDSNMPDIGANTYPIAFGDFKRAYTIVDHVSGTRLLRDPYTKPGWVNFFVVKRIAGGVSNSEALKFMKIAV